MTKIISDKEKITEYLDIKGISKNSFYKKTGFSVGFLDSGKSLGVDKLRIIIDNYPDFDSAKILGLDLGQKPINIQESSDDSFFTEIHKSKIKQGKQQKGSQKLIPLVTQMAIAGFGKSSFSMKEVDIKDKYFVPEFKDRKVDFMIEIQGSSMRPKYNSGDVIACAILKERHFIQWNKVHIVATKEQGVLVKRIHQGENGSLKMISENPNYPPFEIPEIEITGIALVIGVIRME